MSTWEVELERTLLEAALSFADETSRRRFLDLACATDPKLRARIDRLLVEYQRADAFFDFKPLKRTEPIPTLRSTAEGGSASPRYRILRPLGEGGSGQVYLAEQTHPVERQVALKIIRQDVTASGGAERFNLECRALARMTHPNIARVYDTGSTEDGRPYFTMELVAGESITEFCAAGLASLKDRLRLFLQICDAMQHAHQKGIIHRDLKPSNVLIELRDGQPFPKIIDFGIAKFLVNATPEEGEIESNALAGTPAYLSPEQAGTDDAEIDTRTDVFGLGALLHELILGRPPFPPARVDLERIEELRAQWSQRITQPPSLTVASLTPEERESLAAKLGLPSAALMTTLREDLDWVLLKALAVDRADRYNTVHELTLDLQRFLNHEPIAARPPDLLYRTRKHLRRNRSTWLAAASVLLVLGLGGGTSAWFYAREQESRRIQYDLQDEARDTARITRAVYLARSGDWEAANAVLAEITRVPNRPSFEGVTVYRQVGDELARQKRWPETSARFAVVQRFGALDGWGQVTRDHQSYGVALIAAEDFSGFDRFRLEHSRRFSTEANGDAVGRVLKVCLLRPADPEMSERLLPLGRKVETWFSQLPVEARQSWATLPVALWRLRQGDFSGATMAARGGFREDDHASSCIATQRLVLALCAWNSDQSAEARRQLRVAREDLQRVFAGDLPVGDGQLGYWYDWLLAKILLEEASAVIPTGQGS